MKKSIIFESLVICLLMLLIPSSSAIEYQMSNKTEMIKSSNLDNNPVNLQLNEEIVYEKKSTHVIIPGDGNKKYYAIIAGCSQYEDRIYNLPRIGKPFPESSMKYVYNILLSASNWDEENIVLLLNENATKQNILDSFTDMGKIIDGDDVFFFSWTGHGTQVEDQDGDDGDGYDEAICPYDIKRRNGELLNVITDDDLDSYFSMIAAEGLFIMFESCMSGGLVDVETQRSFSFVDVNDDRRVVVMSTPPDKLGFVMINMGFPILMLYSIAFSSNSCDTNFDGWISAEEAFMYVNESYPSLENDIFLNIVNLSIPPAVFMNFLLMNRILRNYGIKLKASLILSILQAGIAYIIYQMDWYKQIMIEYIKITLKITGVDNDPNMCDDYFGDLNIIKIG